MRHSKISLFALLAGTLAVPAFGQTATDQAMGEQQGDRSDRFGEIVVLDGWSVDPIMERGGWSAASLLDEDVYGPDGDDIGEVEDLIFGPEGELLAVIAEVGGFWDIGDTHVSVPWEDVQYAGPGEGIVLPVSEETVEEYDIFANEGFLPQAAVEGEIVAGVDDAVPPGGAWRLDDLIGDYARLRSDDEWVNYGYVTDVIVEDGEIAATLVNAAGAYGYGTYGYPPYARTGYGWNPADPYYDMPYRAEDIDGLAPVDGEG